MILEEFLEFANFIKEEDIELSKFADYSINLKKVSKKSKKSEEEIINAVKSFFENYGKIEIKNGYVNIFLNWFKVLKDYKDKKLIKDRKIGKILVEHTSANPNKALHIGHIRNACLGDSIYRFLKAFENEVYSASYIDDTGAQMAELLLAFLKLNYPLETDEKFDVYCSKVYSEVNKELEKNKELEEEKQKIIKELENVESEVFKFNENLVKRILKEQLKTLEFLKIKFDFLNKESDIISFELIEPTINFLKEKGIAYYSKEKENCLVVKEQNTELVLVRSNNTYTYLAKDIAYAFWKHKIINKNFLFEKFNDTFITSRNGIKIENFENFDFSVNVIGREQALNQLFIQKLLESFGKKYVYYPYGLVFLSGKTAKLFNKEAKMLKMSGRKGIVVLADELINKFKEVVSQSFKENVDEIVRSCIRYEMLKLDKDKDMLFDFEEALDIKGNSAVYLLYSYARINSIINKAEKIDSMFEEYELEKEEIEVLKRVFYLDIVLLRTLRDLKINRLCSYIFELSQALNLFYEKCRVLDEVENKKVFRLNLLFLLKRIYDFIFDIIGIEKINKI
ncbi:MAG: arginine--tRNA ligase [Candidatus Aenigmatarchaeota archaeon]